MFAAMNRRVSLDFRERDTGKSNAKREEFVRVVRSESGV
jgi:hypothetical protein